MNNQLVTIFGASGFLGRHVVRALARKGYRVRAVVRRPGRANHLPPMGHVGQIQVLRGDVREADDVTAAVARASFVVNLTGILYQRGSQNFQAIHVLAAEMIAKAAREAGCLAMVHVSAIGANTASESYYAKSKGRGEEQSRAAFPDVAILRPSIMFGPEDQFFNRFAGLARALPALPLIGGGLTRFQPVYVGDVAAAVLRVLEDASTHGKLYELGGPGIYTFRELMEFILRETGRKRSLLPIPFNLAAAQSFFLQFLPSPLLTPDQVRLLKVDNVVHAGTPTLSELGVVPTSIEAEVPAYLWRFRPRGQFQASHAG